MSWEAVSPVSSFLQKDTQLRLCTDRGIDKQLKDNLRKKFDGFKDDIMEKGSDTV